MQSQAQLQEQTVKLKSCGGGAVLEALATAGSALSLHSWSACCPPLRGYTLERTETSALVVMATCDFSGELTHSLFFSRGRHIAAKKQMNSRSTVNYSLRC